MGKKRQDPLEPNVYLPSKSHPDYHRLSREYYHSQLFPGYPHIEPEKPHPVEKHYRKQVDYIKNILQGWQRRANRTPYFAEEADKYVIDAVKEFGLDALRLPPEQEEIVTGRRPAGGFSKDLFEITYQLGAEVCNVMRYWRTLASNSLSERARATKRLREVAKVLTPDTRGKKKRLAFDSGVVKAVYFELLYDLYQVDHALRSPSGPRNFSLKVKAVSKSFGMQIEQIREFRNLDENNQPKGSPLSIKEMARILTARKFGLTQHTVSNLLASKN